MAQSLRNTYAQRAGKQIQALFAARDLERCSELCRSLISCNEYDEFAYQYLMQIAALSGTLSFSHSDPSGPRKVYGRQRKSSARCPSSICC